MENDQSSNRDFSEYIKIKDDGTKELCLDERQLLDWPEGITNQTHLEGLSLRDNYLTKIPEDINKLINLKILKVDKNKLKHLPDSICELTELKELSVTNNQLSCLPTDIQELTKLENVNLSVNKLTNLPGKIGQLSHLRELNVWYNQLSCVPTSIQQLTELEKLDVGGNRLTNLPDNIGGLKQLRELNVYTNQLSTLPTSIHLLAKLQTLNLYGNRLTLLPDSIGELNELRELIINSNQLSIVPDSIQHLSKLQILNLDGNNLKNLPDSIGDLEELRELSVNNNQLSIVPDSIQHLSKLQRLHLDGNKLKDLPDSIGALKELKELSVSCNRLSIIPDSFKQLTKLQRLNLDRNKLRDLPDSIGGLMELKQLSANSSQLSIVPLSKVNINDQKGLTKLNVRGNPLTFDAVKELLVLKLDRPDIGIDVDVPTEIESQGENVQRVYVKALSDGFVKVYRGRILIVGQERAGKTCLKKNLLRLPFDLNERTDGIEVNPSKVEIDVDQVKNWQSTGNNEQFLGCSEAIAKFMIEKRPHEKDFRTIDCLLIEDKKEIHEEELESSKDREMEEDKGDSQKSQDAEPNVVGATDYTSAQPELKVDATSLPEGIMSHTNQLIKELRCEFTEKEQSVISMDLWDFAGQHFCYTTHPLFFASRAIYLLVHNLSKPLNETAAPYYRQGYFDVKLEDPHPETNLENLLSWLASVHNIHQMKGEDKSDTVQRKPNYLRPPVLIVGTHADKPSENISNIKLQIERTIATKEYVRHVVQPIFSIDNTGNTGESPQEEHKIDTIQALRNRIMEVWNQEPYMGEMIPVRWILFEKVIKALVAGKSHHLSLRQLRCYAKDQCFIEDDAEFNTMMQFYHDLGIIVKHRATVILDVQWLINLYKHLMTVPHFEEADPIVSREWLTFDETGVLSSELIDHVFCKFVLDGVVKEDVLHLMEQFGLIAKFAPFSTNAEYFVPAKLPAAPDDLCVVQPTPSDPCPLYLLLVGDFVPHGLFTQLVARSIHWCSKFGATQIPHLYLNAAWFVIGSRDFSHSFYLIYKKQFIKLVLKQRTKRSQSESSQVATKVRHFVAESLQGLSQDFPYLKGLQYHFGVECPHCQQQKGKCKEHNQESCKDCLHLLELKQGAPLSCENKPDEKLKVPGLEKWFFQTKIQELHVDVISQVDLGYSGDKEMRTPAKKRESSFRSPECLKQRKLSDDRDAETEPMARKFKSLRSTSSDDSPDKTWTSSESKRRLSSEMILHDLQKREFDDSNATSPSFLASRLNEIAFDKGFKISHNEGSGNCMFYALSEQLDLVKGIKIPHNKLRKHIVQYLELNPTLLDGTELFSFVKRYPSWIDYLRNMAQEGTWGDHVILHAAANCFHICIDVVSLTHHQDLRITPEHDVDSSNHLVLGHVHELHYVSLQPINPGAKSWENKFEGNPPQLSVKLPRKSELPKASKPWSDVALPIDILLLTVEDRELVSCFYYLDKPFKSYCKAIGFVFFGSTGSDDQEKLKIALIQCAERSANSGGSSTTVKNAVRVLRPKAVFSVGACTGLNPVQVKLGDVVVSHTLTTPAGFRTPVSRKISLLMGHIAEGWVAPLENPDEREVRVHCGDILSHPQAARHEDLIQAYPGATAFEREGEGLFTAAYDFEVEWAIVKGVASFGEQSSSGDWVSFASTMAASVVANILNEPYNFREWPHYSQGRQMLVDLQKMQYGAKKKITKTKLSEDLKKVASNKGFIITNNEGSGNCMFYALSHQLHHVKGISISHGELRERLVQYLWDNPRMRDGTRLFNFVSGYSSWADYLRSMATDGTWGDHIVLHAAADCFETCILVISTLSRVVTISPNSGLDRSNPLVLGHMHEGHYVSLLPIEPVAVKEGCPSDDELDELSKEIGDTWMNLGHRLDLRKSKLTGFHKGHKETREKAYAMLLEWKKTGASNATYRVLYEALSHKRVSRKDLAMKICCKV